MSVAVELGELAAKVEEFGPVAYLVSVRPDGRPHVVSVAVAWSDDGGSLVAGAGSRTSANVAENGNVTLVWASRPGADYCLLVDGTASAAGDEQLSIVPTGAVLHRVADASDPDAPSCVKLMPQASSGG